MPKSAPRSSVEVVLVDLDHVVGLLHLHAHAVLNHELGQAGAVDQHDALRNAVGIVARALAEAAGGDEDALAGSAPGERADEALQFGALHRLVGGVALGLHVDLAETQGILIDDAVDSPVA